MRTLSAVLGVLLAGVLALAGVVLDDEPRPEEVSGGSGELNLEAVPEEFRAALLEAAGRCPGVSGPLLAAQIEVESGWNPAAVSSAGAQGIAQFMPGTWATWGKDYSGDGVADPFDATDAIGSQADYMCHLRDLVDAGLASGAMSGDAVQLTLASYNAGPGAVAKHGGIPPYAETRRYVDKVLALIARYTLTGGGDGDYEGQGPGVSADGTYRVSMSGSGRLDPSTLCGLAWSPRILLRCDAAAALERLNVAYTARFGTPLGVSDGYRDYASQVAVATAKPHLAARPGTSNHGWGLAADLIGVSPEGSERYRWLRENGPAYGWQHPSWARIGGSKPEAWHWEYVGVRT
jgi:hypothetical protein